MRGDWIRDQALHSLVDSRTDDIIGKWQKLGGEAQLEEVGG